MFDDARAVAQRASAQADLKLTEPVAAPVAVAKSSRRRMKDRDQPRLGAIYTHFIVHIRQFW